VWVCGYEVEMGTRVHRACCAVGSCRLDTISAGRLVLWEARIFRLWAWGCLYQGTCEHVVGSH